MSKSAVIAELYLECCNVFQREGALLGGVETKNAIESVRDILDKVTAADVGIYDTSYGDQYDTTISQRIFASKEFCLDIFIIPNSYCIPFHDHPHMTVCTKMLYGSAHVVAYDWQTDASQQVAILSLDKVLTKEDHVRVLSPKETNIHAIKGNTTCAFLDVIVPPYNNVDRSCTYYAPYGEPHSYLPNFDNVEKELNLVEYDALNFNCIGDVYRGPQLPK